MAVLGDINDGGIGAALSRHLNGDFVEIAGGRGLYGSNLELKIRSPGVPLPQKILDTLFNGTGAGGLLSRRGVPCRFGVVLCVGLCIGLGGLLCAGIIL